MKSKLLLIFIAALLVTSCTLNNEQAQTDVSMRENIIGSWSIDDDSHPTYSVRGTKIFNPSGIFTVKSVLKNKMGVETELDYDGIWSISQGFIREKILSSNRQSIVTGRIVTSKILRVNDKNLVVLTKDNETINRRRIKKVS